MSRLRLVIFNHWRGIEIGCLARESNSLWSTILVPLPTIYTTPTSPSPTSHNVSHSTILYPDFFPKKHIANQQRTFHPPNPCPPHHLPAELWAQILSHLPPASLFTSCRHVSRTFHLQCAFLLPKHYISKELTLLDNRTHLTYSHCTNDVAYFKPNVLDLAPDVQSPLDAK